MAFRNTSIVFKNLNGKAAIPLSSGDYENCQFYIAEDSSDNLSLQLKYRVNMRNCVIAHKGRIMLVEHGSTTPTFIAMNSIVRSEGAGYISYLQSVAKFIKCIVPDGVWVDNGLAELTDCTVVDKAF